MKLEKINDERIKKIGKKLKVELNGSLEVNATKVAAALKKLHPKARILDCSECNFPCPEVDSITECPGCGETFEDDVIDEDADLVRAPEVASRVQEPEVIPGFGGTIEEAKALLAEKTAKIHSLRKNFAENGWEIGTELRAVFEQDLWRAEHKSFNEYVQEKCGFTPQTGRDFISIAKTFRREELGDLSITALRLLAKLPEADRKELAEKARQEKPNVRALAAEAKTRRAAAGLKTERRGMKGIVVNFRAEPGMVAEGELKAADANGVRKGSFALGDQKFRLEVTRAGFKIILAKPAQ